ncbi:MAG: ABC transporter ATP-binding protein [Bacillota bacterium]|nr:ABC transporter ATP-binding protein [Bacillota bacterium]
MTRQRKKAKEKEEKLKYSIWQNCVFMLSIAWRERRSLLWLSLAIAVVVVLLDLTQLFVVPIILNVMETAGSVGRLISVIMLFTGTLMVLHAAHSYFSTCTLFKWIEVRLCIGAMIQNKILTTSFPNTENQAIRKQMDKAMMLVNNSNAATEAIWDTLINLLKSIAGFVVCLSLLAILKPFLIIVVSGTTVVSFFISNYLNSWGYRHREEEAEYSRRMNYLSEKSRDYTLAKDVRIFGMRSWIEDVYASTMRLYRSFIARGERIYFLGSLADVLFSFMRNGVVYLFLIGAVMQGKLSAAQFVLYFNAVGVFTDGISGILANCTMLYKQSLDISAIREFLDCPEPFAFENGISLVPDMNMSYQIRLRDVSFRYPEAESNTLTNINLTLHPGEKLAIVGLNGAGKTTLVKLICGFLDPTEGEVLLNNINIKAYNRRDYYLLFSAVFQDFSLLDVTIAENIAQSDKDIEMKRVKHCARQAGLEAKINSLPNGFHAHLGKVYEDGVEFSGGEMQRLMLARALYKNAPIIVLDEPMAALDPIAESDIYNRYSELTDGRTSLYISHRLASTQFCDRIILLADKGILEEGTHDGLIAKGGRYAELFEIQSRYYREGGGNNE